MFGAVFSLELEVFEVPPPPHCTQECGGGNGGLPVPSSKRYT